MNTAMGDLVTVLRHVVSNTNWGGNQGEKVEATEALDRLTSDQYGDSDPIDTDPNAKDPVDPNAKDPADPNAPAPKAGARGATGTRAGK